MKLATLCYLKKNGKTLMLFRNKKKDDMNGGKWIGLGGKIEEGETPEECAIREIKEESGYIAKNLILKGILTFPAFDGNNCWYVFLYLVTEFEGDMIDSSEGTLKWINDEDLMNLPMWEGDKIFLKWLNEKGIYSGKFIYKDEKFIDFTYIHYS
ncbi:MAG: 8-oxo-dGTP diphosphatase [Spirochaetota bacterium]